VNTSQYYSILRNLKSCVYLPLSISEQQFHEAYLMWILAWHDRATAATCIQYNYLTFTTGRISFNRKVLQEKLRNLMTRILNNLNDKIYSVKNIMNMGVFPDCTHTLNTFGSDDFMWIIKKYMSLPSAQTSLKLL